MGQLAYLDKSVLKISFKMTLVKGRNCPYREHFSIAFFNFFSLSELNYELSNQSTNLLGPFYLNLHITKLFMPKYTKKNL